MGDPFIFSNKRRFELNSKSNDCIKSSNSFFLSFEFNLSVNDCPFLSSSRKSVRILSCHLKLSAEENGRILKRENEYSGYLLSINPVDAFSSRWIIDKFG